MKTLYILRPLLLGILIFMTTSCNKDDDDCKKEENYFDAQFNGETLEPRYITGGGVNVYTYYVNRNEENNGDWGITITSEDQTSVHLSILNLNEPGSYPIETATIEDLPPPPPFYVKTYLYISKDLPNGQADYFSLGDTGSIEITEYDSDTGILVGTFSCELYLSDSPQEIIPVTGEFNINLSTLDNSKRPCWL